MNKKVWFASAPSNLALIKYAGKKNKSNLPLNGSFSYTLDHLFTKVKITSIEGERDRYEPLKDEECLSLTLSSLSVKRFLDFFKILKKTFQVPGVYLVQSANNFPASAGVASSASSFCALTRASYKMALSCSSAPEEVESFTDSYLSILSRSGSGSSCRSFFRPWALWEGEGARAVNLPFSYLIHKFIVVDRKKKEVSSSTAHEKILTSPSFAGRVERAEKRLSDLLLALKGQNWKTCFEITWDEFQDLHTLYENAGIFYRNKKSHEILNTVKTFWEQERDGPLVTMDAGSAVHLLYRPDQEHTANRLASLLPPAFSPGKSL